MPTILTDKQNEPRHTDEMQDIIAAVPSWILRRGITVFFFVLVLIFSLAALIKYPDMVTASLKIDSPNSPKPVVAKMPGKLVNLLVHQNDAVRAGQPLGYIESTANHAEVLNLLAVLKNLQQETATGKTTPTNYFTKSDNPALGELQAAYQVFFQEFLSYCSAVNNGFFVKKRAYLQQDLLNLTQQTSQLKAQKELQQKDLGLAADEYEMHKKLAAQKVETSSEFRQQESKYLAKKTPMLQTEAALLQASGNYAAKEKEILELDNQITEEKAKFLQALNSLISQADDWKNKYVLSAQQAGKVTFAGIVQENQQLNPNQEVFYINPGNEEFFGDMTIPQSNMGKVKEGQQVLIKLKSYPFEEYGMIRGRISYIADVPYKDSIFISRVDFKIKGATDMKKPIHLKQGMTAEAEIITQDATIFQRVVWNLLKIMNNK